MRPACTLHAPPAPPRLRIHPATSARPCALSPPAAPATAACCPSPSHCTPRQQLPLRSRLCRPRLCPAAASRSPLEQPPNQLPQRPPPITPPSLWRWRELRPEGWATGSPQGPADLVSRARTLFLPAGFPSSVTPDYLHYQLWSLPTHITGWLSHSLTTSSLLQAVGLNLGPAGTTALSAAFKWIAKDGIGAAGRLLVGGKLGLELDDDPRRWRMLSEVITSVGLGLEVATSVAPQHFLLLACSGNFAKAIGKGIAKPAFRVIQTHFAVANNVGAVSAKEEVWEVFGQLTGYALSLAALEALEDTGSSGLIVVAWALAQGAHVLLRQRALSCLVFSTLNHKRACLLVSAHVAGQALPDVATLNRQEPLWESPLSLSPSMKLGCSMEELLRSWHPSALMHAPASSSGSGSGFTAGFNPHSAGWHEVHAEVRPLLELYREEQYMLGWAGGCAWVVLKPGAGPRPLLRALWQSAWLHHHHQSRHLRAAAGRDSLAMSLSALEAGYPGFEAEALGLGWDLNIVNLTVGRLRVDVEGERVEAEA